MGGRGCGLMVSKLTFNSDIPSADLTEVYALYYVKLV